MLNPDGHGADLTYISSHPILPSSPELGNPPSIEEFFSAIQFRAKKSVQKLSTIDGLYADDVCFMANNVSSLQLSLNRLNESCQRFGLIINVSKT